MILILQPGLSYRAAPGMSTTKHMRNLRLYLWTKANGRCVLCGHPVEPNQVSPDHIVPASRGGDDGVHNLQATHWGCNRRKSSRPLADAVREIRTGVKEYRAPAPRRKRVVAAIVRPAPVPAPAQDPAPTARKGRLDYRLSQLNSVRVAKGMSVEELARAAGLTVSTVARIECCEHFPHIVSIRKLAQALDCEPADLLGLE